MNKVFRVFSSIIIIVLSLSNNALPQSIDQKLIVVQNDQTLNGNFSIQVQVQGTSLPVANTLGSATIDVQFDNTHLSFVDGTLWAFASAQGYARDATDNTTFIRVGVLGSTVNADGGGVPPGFDIGTSYTSWVQLNFIILNPAVTTSLTINNITNAVGLFENHSNEPKTGNINNQTLSTPVVINNVPLPVELSSFTASGNQNAVNLKWQTATEVNNYGFEVERKVHTSPSLSVIAWEKVGFVNGNGNSNTPIEYSFVDKNLIGGSKFLYRLKQVDNDGQFEYSSVVEVEIVPKEFALYQNYPNPFNPTTKINYSIPFDSKVTISIYSITGELVTELVNDNVEAGSYSANFNGINLASGIYFYRMAAGSFVKTYKMILMK